MLTFEIGLHLLDLLFTAIIAGRLFLYAHDYWKLWGEAKAHMAHRPDEDVAVTDLEERIDAHLQPFKLETFVIPLTMAAVMFVYDLQTAGIVLAIETDIMFLLKHPKFYFARQLQWKRFAAAFHS